MARTNRERQVAFAADIWRRQLINVDATNRLLYYRDLKVGTLDLADANITRVEQLRGGQRVRLGRLFEDPDRLAVARRSVRQIAAKARAAEEEYGVPVSFLAAGTATWDDGRTPRAPAAGYPARRTENPAGEGTGGRSRHTPTPAAPVLLQIVQFEAHPGTPDGFELTTLGEAFVNPVLVHVLSTQFHVGIDEAELLEAAGDDRLVFDLLTKKCIDGEIPGFAVSDRLLVGTFSYLKQPMVDDLGEEQVEFLAENDMIAAIAKVPGAREAVRAAGREVSEASPDHDPPTNEFLVLDADASQSYVINAASAGQNLIVQGPPGTGKSQTIANLIADLVAHDKSVLFVAQKRAAITAVLHRLELVGLAGLALDMFEGGGSRKAVVAALGAALDAKAAARTVPVGALHSRWTSVRNQLTAHQAALHEERLPWNTSVWQLMADERALGGDAVTDHRLSMTTLAAWTAATVGELAAAAADLAASGGTDPALIHRDGWGIDAFEGPADLHEAGEFAAHVQGAALPRVRDAISAVCRACGMPEPDRIAAATAALTLMADTVDALGGGCGPALAAGLSPEDLRHLLEATGPREWRRAHGVEMGWGERHAARKAVRMLFGRRVATGAAHERLGRAQQLRERWQAAGAAAVPAEPVKGLDEARDALRDLDSALTVLQPRVQGYELAHLPFAELAAALKGLVADPYRDHLPRIHQLRARLASAGLRDVVAELEEQSAGPERAERRVRYVFARSALDHVLSTDSRLAGITRAQLDRWAGEFVTADRAHLEANAARVRRIAAESMAGALDHFPEQHAEIKRQIRRKRGFSSVRRLFQDAPDVLLAVKPCWAMSPLMVSQVLPARRLFDVVVFDEASQVMPPDAIPAIARAGQVVVAGDGHQLPPTDFFSRLSVPGDSESDEDVAGAAEADELLAIAPPETRDVESILDTVDVVLAGRSHTLQWHYRSKDEKLIATSNAYVYHNQLITFPGAQGADRIHFEPVEFSTGVGRNNKSPAAEVDRVVELALRHARSHAQESLGVIAFGSDHAARIERALDDRLESEPALRPFFQHSGNEPFFIKNIERVQGDEREAIILSVGYGRADDGRMRYMWGPLLGQGGERRLNVAISRARSRMALVASFTPDDIDPTANRSAGFQLMYRFLQFMASGGKSFGNDPGRDYQLNAFEDDVLRRLSAAGLSLEPQWGVGSYRIDFAARHPERLGRFVLAIECDGATYHSGKIARERDRLRQEHLERLGWRFHRIWSTDWWSDPEPQIQAVLASYASALATTAKETAPAGSARGGAEADPPPAAAVVAAPASRLGTRPRIHPGAPISEYSHRQLVDLIRWIESDDVVRTDDELLEIAMQELHFRRHGQRIVQALRAAIRSA